MVLLVDSEFEWCQRKRSRTNLIILVIVRWLRKATKIIVRITGIGAGILNFRPPDGVAARRRRSVSCSSSYTWHTGSLIRYFYIDAVANLNFQWIIIRTFKSLCEIWICNNYMNSESKHCNLIEIMYLIKPVKMFW